MTGLLASQTSFKTQKCFKDVFVTDVGTFKPYSFAAQSNLQTNVTHYRCDDYIVFQLVFRLQVTSQNPQCCITVDKTSFVIDKKRSISVAIERNTEIRFFTHNSPLESFDVK